MSDERISFPPPDWTAALRQPVPVRPERRAAIMAMVRSDARRAAWPRDARSGTRAARRIVRALAVVTVVAGVAVGRQAIGSLLRAAVPEPLGAGAVIIGDSIAATLHDTLDLVRFALRAPRASRVMLAGDFNAWSATATPLARDASGTWTAVVALHRGDRRFAFLIDDTRWVGAPAASHAPAPATSRETRDTRGDST